jgi:hypothetical protein
VGQYKKTSTRLEIHHHEIGQQSFRHSRHPIICTSITASATNHRFPANGLETNAETFQKLKGHQLTLSNQFCVNPNPYYYPHTIQLLHRIECSEQCRP